MEFVSRSKMITLVVVTLVVVGAAVYAFLQPNEGWPDESRRFSHPAGFSIVAPKRYETGVVQATDRQGNTLKVTSTNSVGNPAAFEVEQVKAPVEAEIRKKGFDTTTFQGQPAWQLFRELKKTREHSRTLLCERNGQWYMLYAHVPVGESLDSGAWAAYFDTFRMETPHAPPPDLVNLLPATAATVPTTLPAATRP